MAKLITLVPLLALWIACGGAPEAGPADATDVEGAETTAPGPAAEPSCSGLDETKCKITAGCAWSADGSGCTLDKAGAFAP